MDKSADPLKKGKKSTLHLPKKKIQEDKLKRLQEHFNPPTRSKSSSRI